MYASGELLDVVLALPLPREDQSAASHMVRLLDTVTISTMKCVQAATEKGAGVV